MAVKARKNIVLLNASTDNTVGFTADPIDGYPTLDLTVIVKDTGAGIDGSFTVVASNADTRPDFTAPATAINVYSPISMDNLDDRSTVAGTGGQAMAAGVKRFNINSPTSRWFAVIPSAHTKGQFTVLLKPCNNNGY